MASGVTNTTFKAEAAALLETLTAEGLSRSKQENTIMQAAIHRTFFGGYDKQAFWQNPAVAARSTFNKWKKHDPDFVRVFDAICDLARTWHSSLAAESIQEALTVIQLHAPEAAWKTVEIMRTGDSEQVQQRMAAKDILQHASKETAEKGQDAVNVNLLNADSLAKFAELGQQADDELHQWRKQQETAVSKTEEE